MIEEKEPAVLDRTLPNQKMPFPCPREEETFESDAEYTPTRRVERRDAPIADEEARLIHRARRGDLDARNRIMEANMGLVVSLARRYSLPGIETADLIQEGSLGLVQAIERFDPSRGFRFSTYATWWVRRAVARALISQGRLIRIPCYIADDIYRIVRTAGVLRQELEREPNADEVAEALGMTAEKVGRLQCLSLEPMSLEAPTYNEDGCLADQLSRSSVQAQINGLQTRDDPLARLVQREETERLLALLSDRGQRVLRMRYGLDDGEPRTREEVGRHFQISTEKVRQIESRACHRIKVVLAARETKSQKAKKVGKVAGATVREVTAAYRASARNSV